jgi:1-acyl-sn-glycerol-3-phosphate acyltransferase
VLVLANHMSWADILVITATAPTIFVAKSEVARWPLIGWIARIRGTVFVDRSRRHQTSAVNADIAARLAEGAAIVLFGEGTSSDGNRVLPFRTALFGAVNDALASAKVGELMVQPLSIAYTRLYGLPMGRQHRPVAAWFGDITLVPHLARFISSGPVDAVLTWGDPIALDGRTDRKNIARRMESAVRQMTNEALRGRPGTRPAPLAAGQPIDSTGEFSSAQPATNARAAG